MDIKKVFKDYWLVLLIPVLIIIDQLTKVIAVNLLTEGVRFEMIENFFYFTLVYNKGGAWSMFWGKTWVLVLVAIIAVGAFGYMFYKTKNKWSQFSLALLISGAIGNIIDRVINDGKVTDFLDFFIFGYDYPVFNFADICVVVGMILYCILVFVEDSAKGKEK